MLRKVWCVVVMTAALGALLGAAQTGRPPRPAAPQAWDLGAGEGPAGAE